MERILPIFCNNRWGKIVFAIDERGISTNSEGLFIDIEKLIVQIQTPGFFDDIIYGNPLGSIIIKGIQSMSLGLNTIKIKKDFFLTCILQLIISAFPLGSLQGRSLIKKQKFGRLVL